MFVSRRYFFIILLVYGKSFSHFLILAQVRLPIVRRPKSHKVIQENFLSFFLPFSLSSSTLRAGLSVPTCCRDSGLSATESSYQPNFCLYLPFSSLHHLYYPQKYKKVHLSYYEFTIFSLLTFYLFFSPFCL